jgi:hypothetical protein
MTTVSVLITGRTTLSKHVVVNVQRGSLTSTLKVVHGN